MITPVPSDWPPSMSALIVTMVGATKSTTPATSMRRSIASRGAATLMASSEERLGGSFIQSVMRFPRNTPAVLATKATTPTANTTRPHPDFVRSGDPSAPAAAPAGMVPARCGGENTGGETGLEAASGAASGAGHFDGGDIGVMMTV